MEEEVKNISDDEEEDIGNDEFVAPYSFFVFSHFLISHFK